MTKQAINKTDRINVTITKLPAAYLVSDIRGALEDLDGPFYDCGSVGNPGQFELDASSFASAPTCKSDLLDSFLRAQIAAERVAMFGVA